MVAHWKIGQGFAIRYGGRGNIQWFKGKEFDQLARGFHQGVSPLSPFGLALEAANSAVGFLQWWESRKSRLLQEAQYEERRIGWLADILEVWYQELDNGEMRRDTIHYLDREVSKLVEKLEQNKLTDVPSSFLLQVERTTESLMQMNMRMDKILRESAPNFVLPDVDLPQRYEYKPYFEVLENEEIFKKYIEVANKIIEATSFVFLGLQFASKAFRLSPMGMVLTGVLWTAPKLWELVKKFNDDKKNQRIQDFIALINLMVEVRSADALLSLFVKLPPVTRVYTLEEMLNNGEGRLLPAEDSLLLLAEPEAENNS
ncbi:MAG: hypothetical protein HXX08_25015 [Chloroflexi bacterium]|uniref:Uncharacterized protein n=1 Tax=Candidatus Chlorohelix allophototropha TaxID=3003348 RepID=A0A8T7MB66_9CHLR|nr:hypothetical protein [Chloroflexota bacterium]WJW70441.1 hypothetical protein OZ401_005077 [Chloroflexota bacterium L227-S17]